MKAAPFAYVRPGDLTEAVAELASTDGGGKVIAGGQSLVPVLAMRLARPETLIDINAVAGLDQVSFTDGHVDIGATVRQRQLERDPRTRQVPLLRLALPFVGHRELRSRGTVCGSLAHADPAAELPAVACCLDGTLTVTGSDGVRQVSAREFFRGAMVTDLGPDDILTSVRLPTRKPGEGYGFAEIARRHGDFALAGVVARVVAHDGVAEAELTGFGVSDRPVTRSVRQALDDAVTEAAGDPHRLTGALQDAMEEVAADIVDTEGDAHASRGYRRRLFAALAARELATAYQRTDDDAEERAG